MHDTLREILQSKRREILEAQQRYPQELLAALAAEQPPARDFAGALASRQPAVIAECKQRSPSKGVLLPPGSSYDPQAIACAYERGGAAAISVLTDHPFFGGSLEHLRQVKEVSRLPILRKDFILEPYQIVEARAYGADSFLLLAGVLDRAGLQYFLEIGRDHGMEALVEAHSAEELRLALATDAKIIGINSRDLKTFNVDLNAAKALLAKYQEQGADRLFVCESGIQTPQDIAMMTQVGYKAFLVGESLIRQPDHEQALRSLLR